MSDHPPTPTCQPVVSTGPVLSTDTVLEVLAQRPRRFALYALIDAPDHTMEFDTLLEEVVTLDAALTGTGLRYTRIVETAVDLYRWHLPVLTELGIVDLDERTHTIRYHPHPPLAEWIGTVRDRELSLA